MPVTSRAVVEFVLLGPTHDRRQLQDSPILGDVWAEFAGDPGAAVDLLISPNRTEAAGPVATTLARRLRAMESAPHPPGQESHVAYLQGIIAARLFFDELLRVVVPMTVWWRERQVRKELETYINTDRLREVIGAIIRWAQAGELTQRNTLAVEFAKFTAIDRYVALAGLILWAGRTAGSDGKGVGGALDSLKNADDVVGLLGALFQEIVGDPPLERPLVWQVSLNRRAMPALERSVPAVKGDAARALFKVKCEDIAWAVLDSGIDAAHPAFQDANGKRRVLKSFDFSNIREVVSLDNLILDDEQANGRARRLLKRENPSAEEIAIAVSDLRTLAQDADNDRPINWSVVAKFVEIKGDVAPFSGHGTHVAGIIGADGERANKVGVKSGRTNHADGMCPDIKLYDFRVLAKTLQDTEFAIIAALQYIRYLNERHTFTTIHGANLSLSIPHDVRNFACGRTPICNECERLIESGVVLVAAAGNLGYHSFETKDGSYEGYTAFSITDPGNADGVITVGATHRFWPHTYGVSFFSSRGPTGDGRMKPDLVAPGERIQSCLPGEDWGELDGTSMAAPHVSGAAAMLMGRYSELVGQPRRIKRLLCESATDLDRERSFQGHGMLDVLRAFQRI
jgi:serine protease AprX